MSSSPTPNRTESAQSERQRTLASEEATEWRLPRGARYRLNRRPNLAIRVVAGVYRDGVLPKPESYAHAFPDLLYFHDAPTVIEQRLFEMHLEHRMRAFQGTFHANPDYALWYGWSEMRRDLTDIQELAEQLRRQKAGGAR